jgi:hypothetical protein
MRKGSLKTMLMAKKARKQTAPFKTGLPQKY